MEKSWGIYGANGYSGRLLAEYAVKQGQKPILAGRSEAALKSLATELDCEYVVVDLADPAQLLDFTRRVDVVVNCAGPFSATAQPMITACIAGKAHYLDITGEMDVFEWAHNDAVSSRARDAGVVVCPGTGFDVVPTDCLAAKLKEEMPDAISLEMAFAGSKQLSQGTAKTSVEGLGKGGCSRIDGVLVSEPIAAHTRDVPYGGSVGEKHSMSIPWGDVSTAFVTTKIPTIKIYVPGSKNTAKKARGLYRWRWLFKRSWIQNFLKKRIEKTVTGPNDDQRTASPMHLWGRVENASGASKEARFVTPNGYDVTIYAPYAIAQYLLSGVEASGSLTPSQLMGSDFVWSLNDVTELEWLN